jgi:hypothetical protein
MSEFYQDLLIDRFKLEEECVDQPRRFMKWSEDFAEAIFKRDKAKQHLKVVAAQVQQRVRQDPDLHGAVSGARGVTEGAIQAVLDTHHEILDAEDLLLEAEKNLQILKSAKEAFDDRKRQLTNLVHLQLGQYYSDPGKAAISEGKRMQEESLAENARLQKLAGGA